MEKANIFKWRRLAYDLNMLVVCFIILNSSITSLTVQALISFIPRLYKNSNALCVHKNSNKLKIKLNLVKVKIRYTSYFNYV